MNSWPKYQIGQNDKNCTYGIYHMINKKHVISQYGTFQTLSSLNSVEFRDNLKYREPESEIQLRLKSAQKSWINFF